MIDRQQLAEAGFTSEDAGTTWTKTLPESETTLRCLICGELLPPIFTRKITISGREMVLTCDAQEGDTADSISKLLDFHFIRPDGRGAVSEWHKLARNALKDFLTRRTNPCSP